MGRLPRRRRSGNGVFTPSRALSRAPSRKPLRDLRMKVSIAVLERAEHDVFVRARAEAALDRFAHRQVFFNRAVEDAVVEVPVGARLLAERARHGCVRA